MCRVHALLASTALGLIFATGDPALAEAVLDGSTGSTGSFSGDFVIPETAGRRAGGNLFHSFERFHVRRGESGTFTGGGGIDNVISRVTGDEASSINGLLASTVPGADFFFLNPNGIVFGPEATLDVPGSFHVSTADELRFDDGSRLSTRDATTSSFVMAAPEAFGFLGADAGSIAVDRGRLTVPPGETLSLTGGPVTIDGGALQARGGRILLVGIDGGGGAGLSGEALFQIGASVQVLGGANVDTDLGGGGEIRIVGDRLAVAGGGRIQADNSAASDSVGGVFVRTNSVLIDGDGNFHGISANARAAGDAGRIDIEADTVELRNRGTLVSNSRPGAAGAGGLVQVSARRLVLDDGASLEARAMENSQGDGGRIVVDVQDAVLITDEGSIGTETFGPGDAGDVRVNAGRLLVDGSATISSNASGGSTGAAGNVTIISTGDIEVTRTGAISSGTRSVGDGGKVRLEATRLVIRTGGSVGSSVLEGATGNAGDVVISAEDIELRRGGFIDSNSFGEGDAGSVRIEAQRLLVGGDSSIASASATGSGGAAGSVMISAGDVEIRGDETDITSATRGAGDGGAVLIEAERLLVAEGRISAQADNGLAEAGEIILRAGSVEVVDGGIITSGTSAGNAGPVTVMADHLKIADGSLGSSTRGGGAGGPVIIRVGHLVIGGAGTISSETSGGGRAGQISIEAAEADVLGLITTRSTSAGDAGTIVLAGERFTIRDFGIVTSRGAGSGAAGSILLRADILTLDSASITTEGRQGGQITTDEGRLRLIHLIDSSVTSNGIEPAPGASLIELAADNIVLNSSQVTSLTGDGQPIVGSGEARLLGNLTVISIDSDVAASSSLEIGGLESDVTAGLEVLPGAFLDVSGQLRESCAARSSEQASSFVQSGELRLAPGPDDFLSGRYASLGGPALAGASVVGAVSLAVPRDCRS